MSSYYKCELSALTGKLCQRYFITRREMTHRLQSGVTKIVLRDLIAVLKYDTCKYLDTRMTR